MTYLKQPKDRTVNATAGIQREVLWKQKRSSVDDCQRLQKHGPEHYLLRVIIGRQTLLLVQLCEGRHRIIFFRSARTFNRQDRTNPARRDNAFQRKCAIEERIKILTSNYDRQMPDNIDRYVPEFDEEGLREQLSHQSKEHLIDLLLRAYKERRVLAKMSDELDSKLSRISAIVEEPSSLLEMPDVPGPDDLRRMTDQE